MKHNCKGTDIDISRAMATAFQVSAKNKKQTGTPITQIMSIKRQAELYREIELENLKEDKRYQDALKRAKKRAIKRTKEELTKLIK